MSLQDQLKFNVHRLFALRFSTAFMVVVPVMVPLYQSLGLSMQEIFITEAIFSLVVCFGEVPSGYLADLLGRRKVLIFGSLVWAAGNLYLPFADGFWSLALYEATLGIAVAMVSGADIALAYDSELALKGSQNRQRQLVGKMFSVGYVSVALSCALASVLLYWGDLHLVARAQAVAGLLPLLVVWGLVEAPYHEDAMVLPTESPAQSRSAWRQHAANFVKVLRVLWSTNPLLRYVCLAACFIPTIGMCTFLILPKVWEYHAVPLTYFGWIACASAIVAAFSSRLTHRVEDWIGSRWMLVLIGCVPTIGLIGLAGLPLGGALLMAASLTISRSMMAVLLSEALNRRLASGYRATAMSLTSFGSRVSFVCIGPPVGFALDVLTLPQVLLLVALLSTLICFAFLLPLGLSVNSALQANEADHRNAADADAVADQVQVYQPKVLQEQDDLNAVDADEKLVVMD